MDSFKKYLIESLYISDDKWNEVMTARINYLLKQKGHTEITDHDRDYSDTDLDREMASIIDDIIDKREFEKRSYG